ncbi:alpha-hydroxy acid oxidase [Luteimonas huabeiensis]|uniref:alpha-hydroxy acid oxidase n=1 Tax=Luteimonas huabeiensis TaxID=1244513 RepID=UPI000465865F|nr:alpha-hydroxy acid oxidase [Luteimonas huabeiensis]
MTRAREPAASTPGDATRLADMTCLQDYEAMAERCLDPGVWAYLNAGAADGIVHRRNREAFARVELLPRAMRRVAGGSAAVELFGARHPHPFLIAPTAYHALAHPDGERATALAAAALQAPFVVSTQASASLEDIARWAEPAPLWFQLYLQETREVSLDLVRRAEAAGYRAIVATVDAPIQGLRNEDRRRGFALPPGVQPVNLARYGGARMGTVAVDAGASIFGHPRVAAMPDWSDLGWIAARTELPVLVKGLLHPLDVEPALGAGAAGVIVSNHGGRVLDALPATLDALPGVVAAVAGRVPVLMDGGIRRGTDAIKALALGASAVLVGRPILHGLAVGGAAGAAHVLNLLRAELEMAMVLCGLESLADAGPALLFRRGGRGC